MPAFVTGRLRGVAPAELSADMVNSGLRRVGSPARARLVVLAHAGASRCIAAGGALALPFAQPPAAALVSENALLRRLGRLPPVPAAEPAAYTMGDVARLSGLAEPVCRTLLLFDVLSPGGEPLAYADLATARQVAGLLGRGFALPPLVEAASRLGRRGLRLSHVRLAAAPWGDIVQHFGGALAELDGQYALVLDERAGDAEASFVAGRDCEDSGDHAAAERHYARAEALDRDDPVIPFNRGNVLVALGRPAEAAIAFRRALDRDPAFAEAAFNLGRLLEDTGKGPEALPWYHAAIAAHPAYAQALYNAARLLTAGHAYAEASPLWQRFIALAPGDPDIGHARRLALLCRLGGA